MIVGIGRTILHTSRLRLFSIIEYRRHTAMSHLRDFGLAAWVLRQYHSYFLYDRVGQNTTVALHVMYDSRVVPDYGS